MTVYVDDMYRVPMGQFGRMKMSHMMADTDKELYAMADRIGVAKKWVQQAELGKGFIHFDVAMSARAKAVKAGAKEITMRELAMLCRQWKKERFEMAKVTKIVASRSCRINLGNYEGLEHFVSMEAELEDGDDPKAVHDKLCATVEKQMVKQLVRSYHVRGKKLKPETVATNHGLSYVPVKPKKETE